MTSNQNATPVAPNGAHGVSTTYDTALQTRLDRLRPYSVEASPVRVTVMVEQAFRNFTPTPTAR